MGVPAAATSAAASAQQLQSFPVTAAPIEASHGIAAPAVPSPRIYPSARPIAPAHLRAAKARAARRLASSGTNSAAAPLLAPSRNAPIFNSSSWQGLVAADNSASNLGTPSDSTGSIGPNHYVEFVNSVVGVYDRYTLRKIASAQLDGFVGASGDAVFDPQIQYDPVSGHWFYLANDIDSSNDAFLAFGWSKTTDPTDLTNGPNGWCKLAVTDDIDSGGPAPPGSYFDDYPKLGHNDTTIVFGSNVFDNTTDSGPFLTARIWAFDKPSNFSTCSASGNFVGDPAGSPLAVGTVQVGTPVPANTTDSSATDIVTAAEDPTETPVGPKSNLSLISVGNSSTFTALGNLAVTSYDVPASVPQPGSGETLDSLDARLTQAVAHQDPDASNAEAVWTQHTVDSASGRSVVRWHELLPASCTSDPCAAATLRQQGTVSNASNFVFNGAISPTLAGNEAVIHYDVGSSTHLVQARAQSRVTATTLGQMTDEQRLATSAHADQDFSCSFDFPSEPCRWGDYAAASPDPNNGDVVWGTTMLNGPAPNPFPDDPAWTTRNFALSPLAFTGPVAAISASPSSVQVGSPVGFDASASSGTITDFRWDLNGDGVFETDTGTTPTVSHTYASAGTVNAAVLVIDDQSASDQSIAGITVNAPPVVAPPPAPAPPNTKLRKHPSKKTRKRTAKFTFGSDQAGTTFKCKLDRRAFKPCSSPKKYRGLKPGKHAFKVKAIGADGAVDQSPSTFKWKVLSS
jgi:PKD domain